MRRRELLSNNGGYEFSTSISTLDVTAASGSSTVTVTSLKNSSENVSWTVSTSGIVTATQTSDTVLTLSWSSNSSTSYVRSDIIQLTQSGSGKTVNIVFTQDVKKQTSVTWQYYITSDDTFDVISFNSIKSCSTDTYYSWYQKAFSIQADVDVSATFHFKQVTTYSDGSTQYGPSIQDGLTYSNATAYISYYSDVSASWGSGNCIYFKCSFDYSGVSTGYTRHTITCESYQSAGYKNNCTSGNVNRYNWDGTNVNPRKTFCVSGLSSSSTCSDVNTSILSWS